MARVTDVFMSGTMGNMVLYRRMDKNCARIKTRRDTANSSDQNKKRKFWYSIKGVEAFAKRTVSCDSISDRQEYAKQVFGSDCQMAALIKH